MKESRLGRVGIEDLRPQGLAARSLQDLADWLSQQGFAPQLLQEASQPVTGLAMDSRQIQPGDIYLALGGAKAHGAAFLPAALAAGASALLTDQAGLDLIQQEGTLPEKTGLLLAQDLRQLVGPLSAWLYDSQPADGSAPRLFGVTGTNGKTTSTYMVNSIMQALGHETGLIGTIEIVAGGQRIPSQLTTPESPHVHSLISVMRQQGVTSAAMEVSSHAIDYRRVDGLVYDMVGFTNLTQDHLDLHGSMESYFASKAQLLTPARARKAVVTVDDDWGRRMAECGQEALGAENLIRLATAQGAGYQTFPQELGSADWALLEVEPAGIGHSFKLVRGDGLTITSSTGLPADFNVSNAALAAVMVYESATSQAEQQAIVSALAQPATLTPVVPGRMQLISTQPTVLVDFAHNPDALQRSLEAIEPADPSGRVVLVFGATGERDQTKRPIMGQIAARYADLVYVTDDDPHGEDPAPIRQTLTRAAQQAQAEGARASQVFNIAPRADAIAQAIANSRPQDSILLAGRGHEVAQDVAGVDIELDDRVEAAKALEAAGYQVLPAYRQQREG